jgi:hypothetical protein
MLHTTLRPLFLVFLGCLAAFAAAIASACGDDPGGTDLPYAYSIDATPDGVIEASSDAGVNRH